MRSRFAAYVAASNKSFALTFPAAILCAAALWSMSDSLFWLVPAVTAVIEAAAKAHEILKRKQH